MSIRWEDLADLDPEELAEVLDSLPDHIVSALLADMPTGADETPLPLLEVAERVLPFYHQRSHTDLLADTLTDAVERAERGEDTRIVVEMPPGEGKSSISSVAFPLYALNRHPEWEVVLVSAESSLAAKWSRDNRRAVTEGLVPNVHISPESQAVTEWETTADGSVIARGVGGQITGRRAKIMVIDDPVKNLVDAHSKFQREVLWETWQSVLKTRLRPGSVVVLVMTRWHEDDLAGRLLSQKGDAGVWQEVRLPAIAEPGDPLGREPGEPLLSPQTEETPEQALARWEQLRAEVGDYVWQALYQQRPTRPGGSVFHADWWLFHTDATLPPDHEGIWISSWDLTLGASGPNAGDFVVGQVWQKHEGICYLRHQVRGRWSFNEQLSQFRTVADLFPQVTTHVVERAANGAAAIDTLKREIPGVVPEKPTESKEVRAIAVAPMVEAKQVSLPSDKEWSGELLAECTGFPHSAPHDDQVDTLTQALKRLRKPAEATLQPSRPANQVGSKPSSLAAMRRGGF